MSRKPNSEQRREEIVGALLAVMAEQGYEKATIQAIALKAGLASGLIHYHFKSKSEILIHLVKSLATLAHDRYMSMAKSARTPKQKLKAYVEARLLKGPGSNTDAVAAWVVIGAEAVRQPEVREVFQEAIGFELSLLESLLISYLDDQGKQSKNVKRLAAGVLAFMEGAFQLASAAQDVMPTDYAAKIAMQLIERYVEVEPARKSV
jgi:TetR/AcrR family transcriptional repressor of bet genes